MAQPLDANSLSVSTPVVVPRDAFILFEKKHDDGDTHERIFAVVSNNKFFAVRTYIGRQNRIDILFSTDLR